MLLARSRRSSFPGGSGCRFSVREAGEGWTRRPQSEGGLSGCVLGGGQDTVLGVGTTQMAARLNHAIVLSW